MDLRMKKLSVPFSTHQPSMIINCGGYTVDKAEVEPEIAQKLIVMQSLVYQCGLQKINVE